MLSHSGFPSDEYGRRLGRAEVRAGFWLSGATRQDGGLVEGGLKLHWGALYHASFGTFDGDSARGLEAFATGVNRLEARLYSSGRATLARGRQPFLSCRRKFGKPEPKKLSSLRARPKLVPGQASTALPR